MRARGWDKLAPQWNSASQLKVQRASIVNTKHITRCGFAKRRTGHRKLIDLVNDIDYNTYNNELSISFVVEAVHLFNKEIQTTE